ncbi:MAG: septal ring lytic transglycosylase RlpA family protein [Acidobacteriota bacterium]
MRAAPGIALAIALAVLTAGGCASSRPPARSYRAPATTVAPGYTEEGLASWYGEPYHGRHTASGPIYDMNEMTAAHRTLPFGTLVRVRNLDDGREATVLINDRGPFVAGRILDLSRAAATKLGAIGPGVIRVRLEVVREGDGMPDAPCWEVQVGAFGRDENVARAERALAGLGYTVRRAPAGGGLTRVRVTSLHGRSRAVDVAQALQGSYPGAVPVPCGGGW